MQTADYWKSLVRQAWDVPQHLSEPAALRLIARRAHDVEPAAVVDADTFDSGRLLAMLDAVVGAGVEGQLDALFGDEFTPPVAAEAIAAALVDKAEKDAAASPDPELCRVVLERLATFGVANPRRLGDGSFGPWASS